MNSYAVKKVLYNIINLFFGMRLSIKNVMMIEDAEIDVKDLTVIAGYNDTGKSTVGKLAYFLTKSFETDVYELIDVSEATRHLKSVFRSIYLILIEDKDFEKKESLKELSRMFLELSDMASSLDVFNPETWHKLSLGSADLKERDKPLTEKIKSLTAYFKQIKMDIEQNKRKKIFELLNEANKITEDKKNVKIQKSIRKILSLNNVKNNISSDKGSIEVLEGGHKIIPNLEIKEGLVQIDKNKKIDGIFPFESAIFIDTPMLLDAYDLIRSRITLFGWPRLNYWDDLIDNLTKPTPAENKPCLNISEIIGGDLSYDENILNKGFEFVKEEREKGKQKSLENNKASFKTSSLASGIKSFGILQLLDKKGLFNKNLLLVIDEPEVHLHPEWQVKYAKVLVDLVKQGKVKVLITSHSPYIITALINYSEEQKIEEKSLFYLSRLENGKSVIEDKTMKKEEILRHLSKPFHKLVFNK